MVLTPGAVVRYVCCLALAVRRLAASSQLLHGSATRHAARHCRAEISRGSRRRCAVRCIGWAAPCAAVAERYGSCE